MKKNARVEGLSPAMGSLSMPIWSDGHSGVGLHIQTSGSLSSLKDAGAAIPTRRHPPKNFGPDFPDRTQPQRKKGTMLGVASFFLIQ